MKKIFLTLFLAFSVVLFAQGQNDYNNNASSTSDTTTVATTNTNNSTTVDPTTSTSNNNSTTVDPTTSTSNNNSTTVDPTTSTSNNNSTTVDPTTSTSNNDTTIVAPTTGPNTNNDTTTVTPNTETLNNTSMDTNQNLNNSTTPNTITPKMSPNKINMKIEKNRKKPIINKVNINTFKKNKKIKSGSNTKPMNLNSINVQKQAKELLKGYKVSDKGIINDNIIDKQYQKNNLMFKNNSQISTGPKVGAAFFVGAGSYGTGSLKKLNTMMTDTMQDNKIKIPSFGMSFDLEMYFKRYILDFGYTGIDVENKTTKFLANNIEFAGGFTIAHNNNYRIFPEIGLVQETMNLKTSKNIQGASSGQIYNSNALGTSFDFNLNFEYYFKFKETKNYNYGMFTRLKLGYYLPIMTSSLSAKDPLGNYDTAEGINDLSGPYAKLMIGFGGFNTIML